MIQPREGYRLTMDSILLARFAAARSGDRVLDLGAGCGVVGLIIAAQANAGALTAVELQPELAQLIEKNATLNHLKNVQAVRADLREGKIPDLEPSSFDLVVANPPYRRARSGRASPTPARRLARMESATVLEDFVAVAARYAKNRGRIAFVFDAARSADLIAGFRACRLEPKRIRFVHPRAGAAASTVVLEARKGGGAGTTVEPPLFLYEATGVYSAEAAQLLTVFTRLG
jgi:tRNA1Val (adenine37-N6)-methyltransferase